MSPTPHRSKRRLSIIGLAVIATLGVPVGLAATPTVSRAQAPKHAALLVPLYDDANPANWTRACSQASSARGGSLVIADLPNANGPGTAPSAPWAKVIHDCYRYGRASVIGYVHTDYGRAGQAGLPDLKKQIDAWYAFYAGDIAGIFLDEVSDTVPGTTTSNKEFYRALNAYVHSRKGKDTTVVLNFGQNPASDWMFNATNAKNADIVVTFEGSYNTPGLNPYTQWQPAAWQKRYQANDFAAIVYDAPDSPGLPQPGTACAQLKLQNIGYVYVGTWFSELAPYYGSLPNLC